MALSATYLELKDCFKYEKSTNNTTCIIENCNNIYRGYYTTTLWNHLRAKHLPIYTSIDQRKGRKKNKGHNCDRIIFETRKDLVKLISIHGRPLKMVEDAPMQNILLNILKANSNDYNAAMERVFTKAQVKRDLIFFARETKLAIANEVKGRVVSVMIDIASRYGISTLGISIQYILNTKTVNRTVGMIRLNESHTGQHISDLVSKTLQELNIPPEKIYTICTDNGANMKRAVKEINIQLCTARSGANDNSVTVDAEDSGELSDSDELALDILHQNYERDDDESDLPIEETNDTSNATLLNAFTDIFLTSGPETIPISNILCCAHTLQLSVAYGIQMFDKETGLISKCRGVMTKLRTQNLRYLLEEDCRRKAVIECTTRWNSVFLMIDRFIELRPFIDANLPKINQLRKATEPEIKLEEQDWQKYDEIRQVLKLVYDKTMLFQKPDLRLCDVYVQLKDLAIKLQQINTSLSISIQHDMKKREESLLKNPPLMASVYLHPDYCVLLNNTQKREAIEHISNLCIKFNCGNQEVVTENAQESQSAGPTLETECRDISELINLKKRNTTRPPDHASAIAHAIDRYENYLKISSTNTFNSADPYIYWHKQKRNEPQLYEVANIIFGAAPTQVSVERAFSGLAFILHPLRTRLDGENLQHIMILRQNGDLFDKIDLQGLTAPDSEAD